MSDPRLRLIDSFDRVHNNLRISVTDRCNIRCVYCMPEDVRFLPRRDILSFEEIERFVRVVAPLGINKLRLTGGEPLVRRELPSLVERLTAIPGIDEIGLTTNGLLLAPVAQALYDAGLKRINISLDAMDPNKFEQLTRRPGIERVLDGIQAAKAAGFDPIKINAVTIRGMTESEVVPLAGYCREHGLEMRFIEYMPLDAGDQWERGKVLFAAEVLELLERAFGPLRPAADQDPRAPAMDYDYDDGGGRVGLIASVSRPFCMSCNRVRLTADGKLRNCLFALEETDIRALLRGNVPVARIVEAVRASIASKWEGHEINTARFIKPDRLMHSIGG